MSSARSADRRKRPRSGFGTALVPFEAAPFSRKPFVSRKKSAVLGNFRLRNPAIRFRTNLHRESTESAEIAAWIVRVAIAPLLHQCLKFAVVPVGQNNSGGDEQVPGSAAPWADPYP